MSVDQNYGHEPNTFAWFEARARREQYRAHLTHSFCSLLHASVTSSIPLSVQDAQLRKADA